MVESEQNFLNSAELFLEKVTRGAGQKTREYFRMNIEGRYKENNKGLVTDADLASEKYLLSELKRAYPDHHIITEESGLKASLQVDNPYIWIIDPLDGTTNFSRGSRYYCISIALCRKTKNGAEPLVTAVYAPAMDEYFCATKGKGAFCNGVRMQVSEPESFDKGYYATGFSYNSKENLKKILSSMEKMKFLGPSVTVRVYGAAALDIAMTAQGIYHGFWELNLSSWDMAAGCLMVQEAGGVVTDFKGEAFDPLKHTDIIGAPKHAHGELLKMVRETF
jgi:myo-inositol-1(or 4)-monophosphatase